MNYSEFLTTYFSNLKLFLVCGFACLILCYYSVRHLSISGVIDPIHFYWTYTFGTSYGIILGLYILGYISSHILTIVIISAVSFIASSFVGVKLKINLVRYPLFLINSKHDSHLIFKLAVIISIILYIIIISKVGLGIFSEVNRFQQNKGVGPLVRVVDALRLFVFTYAFIYIKEHKKNWTKLIYFLFLFIGILISSFSNGAKFALFEVIYAVSLGYIIYSGEKIKLSFSKIIKILSYFSIVFLFALFAINHSLKQSGIDASPQYFSPETPIAIEKIFLRTLSNGDQSYLGLPNDVIDNIPQGNIVKNIASAFLGKNLFETVFGNEDNLYNVGQKILKYHFPSFDYAGGPVSHFDLYNYHYLPIGINFLAIIIIGLLLASIVYNGKLAKQNLFMTSIISTLWMKGLVMLLEPAMGLVYLIDFFLVIFLIKIIVLILPKKRRKNNELCS